MNKRKQLDIIEFDQNMNWYVLIFHIIYGGIWFVAGFAACYFVYLIRCG